MECGGPDLAHYLTLEAMIDGVAFTFAYGRMVTRTDRRDHSCEVPLPEIRKSVAGGVYRSSRLWERYAGNIGSGKRMSWQIAGSIVWLDLSDIPPERFAGVNLDDHGLVVVQSQIRRIHQPARDVFIPRQ